MTTSAINQFESQVAKFPRAAAGDAAVYIASAALATSGAYTSGTVVDCTPARRITLFLSYTPGATAGYCVTVPQFSAAASSPAVGDDSWFCPVSFDGIVTATLLGVDLPSGVDATGDPEYGMVTYRPLAIRTEAGNAADDKIRLAVTFDCTDFRWFVLHYAEKGVTATPGTYAVSISLSA